MGVLHVDGYAGFEPLASKGDVVLAACWSDDGSLATFTSRQLLDQSTTLWVESSSTSDRLRGALPCVDFMHPNKLDRSVVALPSCRTGSKTTAFAP